MPKIIENVREQLLTEAKRQVAERGYAKTTVRSVAGACGVGVGTVYNYFPSKDMLIASFMLDDWKKCIDEVICEVNSEPKALLFSVHSMLLSFVEVHRTLFSDSEATRVFYSVFSERHRILRDQIADILLPICEGDEFLAQFISESVLTWTMAGKSFDEMYAVIEKLLK